MSKRNSLTSRLASSIASLAFLAAVAAPLAAEAQPASGPNLGGNTSSATSQPADTADPVATPATKETVANPYGLQTLWAQGDYVARGTLVILALMSIGSWYILVTKLYESLVLASQARSAKRSFFKSSSIAEAASGLKPGSAFRHIANSGLEASEHHEGALTEHIDRNAWVSMSVERSLDDVQSRLQDGLAFLATVGSTAPFIGLFGTVWGIYNALTAIGVAGQASIDKVAGPVGEALIMTAFGLFVAVPAVLGYNWLVRRNKVTMQSVRRFGADLHGVLMGARMGAAAPVR